MIDLSYSNLVMELVVASLLIGNRIVFFTS